MCEIDALVAKLALMHTITVATIVAMIDTTRVVAVFVFFCLGNEVAILRFTGTIGILGIDIHMWINKRTEVRNAIAELLKLLKKWSGEVEWLRILHGIPLVTEPLGDVKNGKRRICRMHCHHCLSGEITLSMVEISFVPKGETPLITTVGAMGWGRNLIRFSHELRGHFVIEIEIPLSDFE
jgi:hypothetical protein